MLNPEEQAAIRFCARVCWQRRKDLQLSDPQLDAVLVAWMKAGSDLEAESAAEVLAARRAADRKQAEFDALLDSPDHPTPTGN